MNKNNKNVKSGRTKNSYSFVRLPMSALAAKITDQSTEILLPKKYADMMGIVGVSESAVKMLKSVKAAKIIEPVNAVVPAA